MGAYNTQSKPNLYAPRMPQAMREQAMQVFEIPSTSHNELSMGIFIAHFCDAHDLPYTIDGHGNIIVTKGHAETYPCFCAHLDTVHTYTNGYNVECIVSKDKTRHYAIAYDNDNKNVGIGGDDKCGVFVCLQMLCILDTVRVFFFSCEETGGKGSSNIDKRWFEDARFLCGVDRWGGSDFITTYGGSATVSKEFKKDVKPLLKRFNYKHASGLFTDAFNLITRDINISCINVSCGYYQHHSSSEYVDLNELYNSVLLCTELGALAATYTHRYERHAYGGWNSAYRGGGVYRGSTVKFSSNGVTILKSAQTDRRCKLCNRKLILSEDTYCYWCKPKAGVAYGVTSNTKKSSYYGDDVCWVCGVALKSSEHGVCYKCETLGYDWRRSSGHTNRY